MSHSRHLSCPPASSDPLAHPADRALAEALSAARAITGEAQPLRAANGTLQLGVIARICPGARDLEHQIGTLYLDFDGEGTIEEATFQPMLDRLLNVAIAVDRVRATSERIVVTDATGRRWAFELDDLDRG